MSYGPGSYDDDMWPGGDDTDYGPPTDNSRRPDAIWVNDYGATMTYAEWSKVYAGCEMDAVCVANWRYSGKRVNQNLSP